MTTGTDTLRKVRKLLRPADGKGLVLYLECGHTMTSTTHDSTPAADIFSAQLPCETCAVQDASWESGRQDGAALARQHQDVRTRDAAKEIIRGAHRRLQPPEGAQAGGVPLSRKRWAKGLYFGYWRTMVNENGVPDGPDADPDGGADA